MIQALRQTAVGSAGAGVALSAGSATAPTDDFAAVLASYARQGIETMRQGEAAAVSGLSGTIPVQEVVGKVMAAEQALQAGIALRDKIVAAYLEVSRMTI